MPVALVCASAALGAPGCVGGGGPGATEGPFEFYRQVTGQALEGREPPPGATAPYPNLATVPSRPSRGEASAREGLISALAAARAASSEPVRPDQPVPDPPATPGAAEIPRDPPRPPRLAAAPPVGPGQGTPLLQGAVPDPGPTAPVAPPADLLAPPPSDLSAPPPPVLAPPRPRG